MGIERGRAAPTSEAPPVGSRSRAVARLARQTDLALADVDLSLAQFRVLILLAEGPAVASRMAEHLAVSRPTVTSAIDGLVSRGLVARRQDDEADRRHVTMSMTTAGQQLLDLAERAIDDRLREIAAYLNDPRQIEAALAALDLWLEALEEERAARRRARS